MSKLKSLKLIISGFLLGAVMFGGVSYAASGSVNLSAYFGVKIIQNGIDKRKYKFAILILNRLRHLNH
ncbi:hypothetical protein [Paenibacillus sp. V4I5]|uniref:hypothetical protein n=1 Tax=Paenibacillus sp. V4I5 TaxID=3042306 RepID=UPI0027900C15|nr:hypothetical protein [Paenibacillus sp. V4I5]MDQ0917026.1 hypothetical protein [Paenibacillus sp. V4I5]